MTKRLERRLLTVLIYGGAAFFFLLALLRQEELDQARALAHDGVQTMGRVTQLFIGGRRVTHYYFVYEFQAAGRGYTSDRRETTRQEHAGLREGMRIPVRFDPDKPESNITAQQLADLETWSDRAGYIIYAFALLAWGGWRAATSRAARPKAKSKAKAASPRKPRGIR